MKNDKLLNWAQVCALLGCRRSYFYVLINSGQLPHVRVGSTRGIRVLESDVRVFIHARSTGREEKGH
ncbi:helix-turn-helix domain-containing protein [Desulfovibrio sp. ZJ200]|uniref:helix-turn-helix transcriptional regulator n=1 Tax=Desulfovibrio sp. ZJ200 TaxID=2709792 RepID=UPI001F14FCDF|nr:helix-turn-helix domain-containing protein [Desulfovibrio sp. ZJ200]